MRIDVVTIFPDMFEGPMSASMIGLARERGILEFSARDLRDWTTDRHRTTDDYPYGGGPGMVMKPEPVHAAVEDLRSRDGSDTLVVFMTPAGRRFDQSVARELSAHRHVVFVCGRYEGFDQRCVKDGDMELSIGDYVLTGGELPAMVVIDAVVRLLPGVLGDCESSVDESFSEGLLEYPQYTRPAEFAGRFVPEVLLSGDHGRIARWRREQSLRRTVRVRPDLIDRAALSPDDAAIVDDEIRGAVRPTEETDE